MMIYLLWYFLDMDTDFAGGLIVNPSDVKVEPPSPSSTPSPAPSMQMKVEPDLVIKQEMNGTKPPQQSVLKQPQTILITSSGARTTSNTTRLLVPKLPTTTTVKLETGDRGQGGGAGGVAGPAKILVSSGGHAGLKSSTRRAIDSHLISNNTVGHVVSRQTFSFYNYHTNAANAE